METRYKKVIAKEFLIFLFCIFIGLVVFQSIYFHNLFIEFQVSSLEKDKTIEENKYLRLSKRRRQKEEYQIWFTDSFISRFNLSENMDYTNYKIWHRLYEIAKQNRIKSDWNNIWQKEVIDFIKTSGFNTPEQFQSFILTNTFDAKDIEAGKKLKEIELQKNKINERITELTPEVLYYNDQFYYTKKTTLILLFILFVLRYLFYGVIWSIKTLRQP